MTRWAILTGEYPPQPGGVSDYTAVVAAGLAAAGDAVTVYAPAVRGPAEGGPPEGSPPEGGGPPGPAVVRLPDHFGRRGLSALDRALARDRPDRVLVQYVPHAFGYKAMNLPFAARVATWARRRGPVWVMFHEVGFPFGWRPKHAALAAAHRVMAGLVAGSADRVFVAIPAWGGRLRRCCPLMRSPEWLPVPSNVPAAADPADVRAARAKYAPHPAARLVGHFGTFGVPIRRLVGPALCRVLRAGPASAALLVGRGSEAFREHLVAADPDFSARVSATGDLLADAIAAHLRACDLLVQPYPDGVSTRRTSVMAGLASGVPVVSNLGPLSEPFWPAAACVGLAPGPEPTAVAEAALAVLALPSPLREDMGRRAADLYRDRFGVDRVVARLRERPPPAGPAASGLA